MSYYPVITFQQMFTETIISMRVFSGVENGCQDWFFPPKDMPTFLCPNILDCLSFVCLSRCVVDLSPSLCINMIDSGGYPISRLCPMNSDRNTPPLLMSDWYLCGMVQSFIFISYHLQGFAGAV